MEITALTVLRKCHTNAFNVTHMLTDLDAFGASIPHDLVKKAVHTVELRGGVFYLNASGAFFIGPELEPNGHILRCVNGLKRFNWRRARMALASSISVPINRSESVV